MSELDLKKIKKADLIEENEALRRQISELEKALSLKKERTDSWKSQIAFLQSIKESPSTISIVSTDLNGNVLFWNKGAENLLGYTADEMAGKQKIGIVYPADDKHTKKTVVDVAKFIIHQKRGITCEVNEITKGGCRLRVRLTLSPRFNETGEVIGILGIGENITERKHAEKALAERVRLAAFGAEVGSALAGSNSLCRITQQCVDSMVQNVGASLARIWTLHSGDKDLELLASAGNRLKYKVDEEPLPGELELLHKTLEERRIHRCPNLRDQSSAEANEWLELEGITSFVCYPLIVDERLMGVMNLYSRSPLTEAAQHALATVADEVSLGIERIWAYGALRASEERIRSIVANALDGIITIYNNGAIESFNPAAETIFGYEAGEMIKQDFGVLLAHPPEGGGENFFAKYSQAVEETIGRVSEVKARKKDGAVFPMELAVSKLQLPERRRQRRIKKGQRPYLFIAMVRDITERKRFETVLKKERDYTAHIIEKSNSMICGLEPDGTIKFANPAVLKTTGYSGQTLIGKNWWTTFFPGPESLQVEKLFEKFGRGPVVDYEMVLTMRSGEKRTVLWTSVSRFDDSGQLAEINGFATDITERKQAELRLIEAVHKAEESNRLKSDFISTISHEFRTPLNVMLGNTPLLTREDKLPPSEEIVNIVRDIDCSGKLLLSLIDDLLDFSKIEADKMTLSMKRCSIKKIVEEAVSSVQIIANNKGLPIQTRIEDSEIDCDPVRLKQILLNLLSNAIKFTDEGSVTVEAFRKNDSACFRIKDTGCGITEADLKYIFEMFRQVDSSDTRAASGTGLGLSITKKLVEMHHGEIFAESKVDLGTTFTFILPLTTDFQEG